MDTNEGVTKYIAWSDLGAKVISNLITGNGGCCVKRGWAVITDHVFNEVESDLAFPFVGKFICSDDKRFSEDDWNQWNKAKWGH